MKNRSWQSWRPALLAALVVAPALSQTVSESEGVLTITPSFASAYMFRGVWLGGLSFQPAVEYSKGPLELGLFSNFLLTDKSPDTPEIEFDLAASYTWTLVPDVLTIKPGVMFYAYPTADKIDAQYYLTCEPNVSLGYTVGDMDFSLNYYYDIVMKGPTYELGIDYLLHVKPIGIDVELSALMGKYDWSDADASVKTGNRASYLQVGALVPYKFSKRSSLSVGWYFSKGINNHYYSEDGKIPNPGAIEKGVFTLNYSYSF